MKEKKTHAHTSFSIFNIRYDCQDEYLKIDQWFDKSLFRSSTDR